MSDKEKIKEEIEKRIRPLDKVCNNKECETTIAYKDILKFIDSLQEEPASEVLEEEMIKWHKQHFNGDRDWDKTSGEYLTRKSQLDIARHFAEWQRQKDIQMPVPTLPEGGEK